MVSEEQGNFQNSLPRLIYRSASSLRSCNPPGAIIITCPTSKLLPPSSPSFPSLPFPFLLGGPLHEWCTISFLRETIPFSIIFLSSLREFFSISLSPSQHGHRAIDVIMTQTKRYSKILNWVSHSFPLPDQSCFAQQHPIEETVSIVYLRQRPHWSGFTTPVKATHPS